MEVAHGVQLMAMKETGCSGLGFQLVLRRVISKDSYVFLFRLQLLFWYVLRIYVIAIVVNMKMWYRKMIDCKWQILAKIGGVPDTCITPTKGVMLKIVAF